MTETRRKSNSRKKLEYVTIGAFGVFEVSKVKNLDGAWLQDIWMALEDLSHDIDWWIGIYSKWGIVEWAKHRRILTAEELQILEGIL